MIAPGDRSMPQMITIAAPTAAMLIDGLSTSRALAGLRNGPPVTWASTS
jgi:hypothetical protein